MDGNPYEPPKPDPEQMHRRPWNKTSAGLALLAFPLPWLVTFFAWFAFPFTFFQMPLPVFPLLMSLIAIYWVIALSNQLIPATRRANRIAVIVVYIIAIVLAMPIGLETYSYLGFREPMP